MKRSLRPGLLVVVAGAPLLVAMATLSPSAGEVAAIRPTKQMVFPLKLSENRRYLVDQNGTPFLIVADSPQGLMNRLTEKEAEAYFADREAHGFNTLGWINVLCAGRDYPANTYAATPDGIRPFTAYLRGGSDYTYYDLGQPNEAYFVRLDHMLWLAKKHQLAVFLDPIETNGWMPVLRRNGVEAAYRYGQFLGHRYGNNPNVLWINGNDFSSWQANESGALPTAAKGGIRPLVHTWRERNDDALVQAVSRGIRAAAPRQLQTVELEFLTSSSFDDPSWRPLIELNGTYTYYPSYMQMLHSYDQSPIAPTFLMETRYEFERSNDLPGDDGTPYLLRKQEYWAMLSGGTGQFYGNGYTWPFNEGWRDHLDSVGVQQIAYWKSFFLSLPWQDLVPDQDHAVLVSGSGAECDLRSPVSQCDYAWAARSADATVIVIYMPTGRMVKVNLGLLRGPERATWFDPSSGAYIAIGGKTLPNSGIQEFTPPGENHSGDGDWVLTLRFVDKDLRKARKRASR